MHLEQRCYRNTNGSDTDSERKPQTPGAVPGADPRLPLTVALEPVFFEGLSVGHGPGGLATSLPESFFPDLQQRSPVGRWGGWVSALSCHSLMWWAGLQVQGSVLWGLL